MDRTEAVNKLERAAALSDYLAKAYEDKVRAIEMVEQKNEEEIKALKEQIDKLQQGAQSSTSSLLGGGKKKAVKPPPKLDGDVSNMSNDDLKAKLQEFESYMLEYMSQGDDSKTQKAARKETRSSQKVEWWWQSDCFGRWRCCCRNTVFDGSLVDRRLIDGHGVVGIDQCCYQCSGGQLAATILWWHRGGYFGSFDRWQWYIGSAGSHCARSIQV
jgi:hypothetical protein